MVVAKLNAAVNAALASDEEKKLAGWVPTPSR